MAGRRPVGEKWKVCAVRARESLFPGSPAPPEPQDAPSTTTMARLKSPAQLLPALPLNVADSAALRDQAARVRLPSLPTPDFSERRVAAPSFQRQDGKAERPSMRKYMRVVYH